MQEKRNWTSILLYERINITFIKANSHAQFAFWHHDGATHYWPLTDIAGFMHTNRRWVRSIALSADFVLHFFASPEGNFQLRSCLTQLWSRVWDENMRQTFPQLINFIMNDWDADTNAHCLRLLLLLLIASLHTNEESASVLSFRQSFVHPAWTLHNRARLQSYFELRQPRARAFYRPRTHDNSNKRHSSFECQCRSFLCCAI